MKILFSILACFGFVTIVAAFCFTAGCSLMTVSDNRPKYSGPIVKPIWTADIATYDTPVMRDGMVYAMGAGKDSPVVKLFALEASSGRPLWSSSFVPNTILGVSGERIFVKDSDHVVHVLEPKTGKDHGVLKTPDNWESGEWAADTLYGWGAAMQLSALTEDGKVKWQTPLPLKERVGGPVIDGTILVMRGWAPSGSDGQHGSLLAYDRDTGKLLWKKELNTGLGFSPAVIANGTLYVTEQGPSKVKSFSRQNPDGSTTSWNEFGQNEHTLHAYEALTGHEKWTRPANGSAAISGGPSFVEGDTLYVEESPKDAARLYRGVNALTGAGLSEAKMQTRPAGGAAFAQGLIFFSDGKQHKLINEGGDATPARWLTAVDAKTGEELWRSEQNNETEFTGPAVEHGIVVIGAKPFVWNSKTYDGRRGVYAFRANRTGK